MRISQDVKYFTPDGMLEEAFDLFRQVCKKYNKQQSDKIRALVLACIVFVGRKKYAHYDWSPEVYIKHINVSSKSLNRTFSKIAKTSQSINGRDFIKHLL